MDENVCPLCCEDFDLSDREFYPCKCGYQVCMWCWHRIRETETGLCPACRTPYGEDPHAFSAVDVEEVLKANKEKEKQQMHNNTSGSGGGGNSGSNNGHSPGAMEVPKDRTQLANMRVIRRNLVYAVGLPASTTEDVLRKAEYFGQYGKISKMVLNRSNNNNNNNNNNSNTNNNNAASSSNSNSASGSRASASAYVTFVHKQDTLACILALDGFYLENRNIRASFGTSKYCSAFIKNVRCNNPECTYLHEMGDLEDTFTKQEIQAGYVTSGRDVLARQQQIMAEQMRLAGTTTGSRKRTGGGGPSGTGRHANHPVLPPPEFDEPSRPRVPAPPGGMMARAITTTHPTPPAMPKPGMAVRAASAGGVVGGGGQSPTLSTALSSLVGGGVGAAAAPRRKSAASIVAGKPQRPVETASNSATTLTPLTPLKRAKTKSMAAAATAPHMPVDSGVERLVPLRNGKKKGGRNLLQSTPTATTTTSSSTSTIGGELIGGHSNSQSTSSLSELNNVSDPVGPSLSSGRPSALGGQVFTGDLLNKKPPLADNNNNNNKSDRWNTLATGPMLDGGGSAPGVGAAGGAIPSAIGPNTSSSSALASILGINLPTGSGSLHESNLWNSMPTAPPPMPSGPSALSSLNGSAIPLQQNDRSMIGGLAIGGGPVIPPPIGSENGMAGANASSQGDIALLQSLLPGVNITGGGGAAIGGGNWAAPGAGTGSNNGYADKSWSNNNNNNGGGAIGHPPQGNQQQRQQPPPHQQQQRQHGADIW